MQIEQENRRKRPDGREGRGIPVSFPGHDAAAASGCAQSLLEMPCEIRAEGEANKSQKPEPHVNCELVLRPGRPKPKERPVHPGKVEGGVPWQLQHMALTCEDAVRRIDELCAATQQMLLELGLERKPEVQPEVQGLAALTAHAPPPLGTRSVLLPCGRCLDLDAIAAKSTTAQVGRERVAEQLRSGELYRTVGATAATAKLSWSQGHLRDFVRRCFGDLGLPSPTELQIYEVYSHFDPALELKPLAALEAVCLVEVLLRAAFHNNMDASAGTTTTAGPSASSMSEHPTQLAERWVEDYVPLPVQGTVSIAYSTGVVIQFADFQEDLQRLAAANADHSKICDRAMLQRSLDVFRRLDPGSGQLCRQELCGFVSQVFTREGLVPPSPQQVAPFFEKFAQGGARLNTSECLCLLDAMFRALLHCDGKVGPLGVSAFSAEATTKPRAGLGHEILKIMS